MAGTPALARTWTSADGTKTFEGEFRSFDAATGKVSVNLPNGTTTVFTADKLSAADQQWLKEQPAPSAAIGSGPATGGGAAAAGDVAGQLAAQKIGSKLAKTLVKLSGRSYKRYQLEKAPEYYIAYFSASW